jgi:hypothetical protein
MPYVSNWMNFSGPSAPDFGKCVRVQQIFDTEMRSLSNSAWRPTNAVGLEEHARAAEVRR